jgi:hypothetical protein
VPYLCTSKAEAKRYNLGEDFYQQEDIMGFKQEDLHETQFLLDFVNKRFGNDVQLSIPLSTVVIRNLIFFGVLFVALNMLAALREHLINPYLWISIAFVGYIICTSGVVFTMSHGMPIFRFDQDQYGKMYVSEYFNRNNRQQWGGEGYIVSTLSVAISACFFFIYKIDKIFAEGW